MENTTDMLSETIDMPNESHLACVLLLDTSNSMTGAKIDSLNDGLARFIEQVKQDKIAQRRLDVAIVEFNTTVEVVQDFLPISQITAPTLTAKGWTHMGEAIEKAVEMAKERNRLYASVGTPAHKPWIFMITDGVPEGEPPEAMDRAIELVQLEERKGDHGKLKFWSLAVQGTREDLLHKLSDRVLELEGKDFTGIFDWLAKSMVPISVSTVGSDPQYAPLPPNIVPARW